MPELAPDDSPASTDEAEQPAVPHSAVPQAAAERSPSQPEHAEPTEQPEEDDEPQAGSPS